jgi:hypothetical protein
MRFLCQTNASLARLLAIVIFGLGCGSNPDGPLNPDLSGVWISPGVDTYSQFSLQERGDSISGTLGNCSANTSTCDTFVVSGFADLPNVELEWVQGGVHQTFAATLSDDHLTLTGNYSPGPYSDTYHRQQPISGRVVAALH